MTLEAQAGCVQTGEDLARLREGLDRLGVVHPVASRKAAPRPREAPTRVRRHTTEDGFVILVGRSGAENDTLTFKVASPEDFWLHAAGSPGAHVVVRNPGRVRSLPEGTLRAAAGIAAHYSGARGEGKVEVHYTQRKHVRKRKGMPPGQVLVRKFQSIQVAPRLPAPMAEDV
jgi:predicted ribosome quality control (RQC) complex YloA/Tae2 family protein